MYPRPVYEASFWTPKEVYETSRNRMNASHSNDTDAALTATERDGETDRQTGKQADRSTVRVV